MVQQNQTIDKNDYFDTIKQADGDDQFIVRGLTVVRQRRLQRFRDFFGYSDIESLSLST